MRNILGKVSKYSYRLDCQVLMFRIKIDVSLKNNLGFPNFESFEFQKLSQRDNPLESELS